MILGEKFLLHNQTWMFIQDIGGTLVLACDAEEGAVRQVFVVDVCTEREKGETVKPEMDMRA